jgi:hypothetical protein
MSQATAIIIDRDQPGTAESGGRVKQAVLDFGKRPARPVMVAPPETSQIAADAGG